MAIIVGDNFSYKGKLPNFERDRFETLAAMKNADENIFDDGHISFCDEDKKTYRFLSTNEVDETTGKWREFGAGTPGGDTLTEDAIAKYRIGPYDEGWGVLAGAPINTITKDLMSKEVPAPKLTVKFLGRNDENYEWKALDRSNPAKWEATVDDLNGCKLTRYEMWNVDVDVEGNEIGTPTRTGFRVIDNGGTQGMVISNGVDLNGNTLYKKCYLWIKYTDANDIPRIMQYTKYIHKHGAIWSYFYDTLPVPDENGVVKLGDNQGENIDPIFVGDPRYDVYEGKTQIVHAADKVATPKYLVYVTDPSGHTDLLGLWINGVNYLERGSLLRYPIDSGDSYIKLVARNLVMYCFPIPMSSNSDIVLEVEHQYVLDNIKGGHTTIVTGGTGVSDSDRAKWNAKLNYTINETAENVQFTAG